MSQVESLILEAEKAHQAGDLARAQILYLKCINETQARPENWNNLGVIFRDQQNFLAALACFREAVALNPANPILQMNLGDMLSRIGKPDEAIPVFKEVVKLDQRFLPAWAQLAQIYMTQGNFEDGHYAVDRALEGEPNNMTLQWTKAFGYLFAGDYERGFKSWECRRDLLDKHVPRPNIPLWTGENLEGKTLLVFGEQGLGDVMQFVRFLTCLPENIGKLIFEVPIELRRLLEFSLQKMKIEFRNHGSSTPFEGDYQISLLSLPSRVPGFPTEPTLFAPPTSIQVNKRNPKNKAVGICWAGNPTHRFDRDRSSSFPEFFKALARPGIELFSLQMNAAQKINDPLVLGENGLVRDLSTQFKDFADTAGAIAQLDAVVTVDTSVAHLAGAMGKRVHVLLPFHGLDWRWGLTGNTSRWYPSMKLHRRERTAANWDQVLEEIAQMVPAPFW